MTSWMTKGLTGLALMLAGVSVASQAHATTGLEWQWETADGQPNELRYFVNSQVKLAELMWFNADYNRQARVAEFVVRAVVKCTPEKAIGPKKPRWDLKCEVEDVALEGAPISYEAGMLAPVLEEMDAKYSESWLQVPFKRDGTIVSVDLEGVDKRNRRIQQIHETLRLMMVRAISPLDLQFPNKGDDKGRGEWTQNGPLVMLFPSNQGTLGSVRLTHKITGQEGDIVSIASDAEGTLGAGGMISVGGVEQPKYLYSMTLESDAKFDVKNGWMVERRVLVQGNPTASSAMGEAGRGFTYAMGGMIKLIGPDDEMPDVGPTGEMAPVQRADARAPLVQNNSDKTDEKGPREK